MKNEMHAMIFMLIAACVAVYVDASATLFVVHCILVDSCGLAALGGTFS